MSDGNLKIGQVNCRLIRGTTDRLTVNGRLTDSYFS
jgi:hypothetical protein